MALMLKKKILEIDELRERVDFLEKEMEALQEFLDITLEEKVVVRTSIGFKTVGEQDGKTRV